MPPESTFDEATCRRPTFLGGHPIPLADGQSWTIPVPERFYGFDASAEDGVRVFHKFGGKPDDAYDVLFAAMQAAAEDDEGTDRQYMGPALRLMRHLLGLNYDVSDEQASVLLAVRYKPGVSDPTFSAFMSCARGVEPPKPTGGGLPLL